MRVSKNWLKELVNLNTSIDEVERLLPLRTIGLKEATPNYFELDMKGYNRADLLSLRGVAYEIAAITDSTVSFKEMLQKDILSTWKDLPEVIVKVENPDLVPLYCIAKIEGLKIDNSPEDWVNKLSGSGYRSINSVADITNLIMVEFGQPLHAFDIDNVQNQNLIVRKARKGETLTTLDGKNRILEPFDLLITDPEKVLGLAGVMGGKESEVKDKTHTIILEAAIFDPITIRGTSQRLGLPSEASKRFQHRLTKTRLIQALYAAIQAYQKLGGRLTAITIVGNIDKSEKEIPLSISKLNSLVGIDFDADFIKEALEKLQFTVQGDPLNNFLVKPPYWRLDIEIEEDVIEEVARMYGYEKIPAKSLPQSELNTLNESKLEKVDQIREKLANLGLVELETYSFYTTEVINNLTLDKDSLIKIANPMSKETEYLRNLIWPNLVEKTVINLKERSDLAIFELGKIYHLQNGLKPAEQKVLSILVANGSNNPLKELISIIHKTKLIENYTFENTINKLFHPKRYLKIIDKSGNVMGTTGEIHPRITDAFQTSYRIAVLELQLD